MRARFYQCFVLELLELFADVVRHSALVNEDQDLFA